MTRLTRDELEPYRRAVSERICTLCNDRDMHGRCSRSLDDPCALVSHLDVIVEAVLGVNESPVVESYLRALRRDVCPTCREDDEGNCALRDIAACAPDAYLLPVVDVIEDTARDLGHGKWSETAPAASSGD